MPKWVYPTAFVFLLFLIFTRPDTAGSAAGDFASFIGEMLRALGEFLSGLFGGVDRPQSGVSSDNVILEQPQTTDTFDHTHDFTNDQ